MYDDEALLKALKNSVDERGQSEVLGDLIKRGVGISTAERLTSGRYNARPSHMLRRILTDLLSERLRAS